MQGAVFSAVELPGSQRRRGSRSERGVAQDTAAAIEFSREIPAASLVELEAAPPAFEDVLPAERSELVSRITNVTIAVLVAVVLAPLFALIALAVKLTSRGPVF